MGERGPRERDRRADDEDEDGHVAYSLRLRQIRRIEIRFVEAAMPEANQRPCVLIATPTRGSPKMRYMQSVIGTIKDLATRRIPSEFKPKGGGNVVFQR